MTQVNVSSEKALHKKERGAACKYIFHMITMLPTLEHQYGKRLKINPFISIGAITSTPMLLTALIRTPSFPLEQTSDSFLL
jgi:hypothetical protein